MLGPYFAVAAVTLALNAIDIYFLQSEKGPSLHRSPSFWFYLIAHVLIALFAAWFLYTKASMSVEDWPIVTAIAAFTGLSVVQSFTLKLGGHGVDARQLFDTWKDRVLEDVAKANASLKLARLSKVSGRMAKTLTPAQLEDEIRVLAPSVSENAADVVRRITDMGGNPARQMALWIASVDLEYADNLLKEAKEA